jgi:hypothetical protein
VVLPCDVAIIPEKVKKRAQDRERRNRKAVRKSITTTIEGITGMVKMRNIGAIITNIIIDMEEKTERLAKDIITTDTESIQKDIENMGNMAKHIGNTESIITGMESMEGIITDTVVRMGRRGHHRSR